MILLYFILGHVGQKQCLNYEKDLGAGSPRDIQEVIVMAKKYAKAFYDSRQWQDCRRSYISKVHGLCEHCLKEGKHVSGYIVDHVIEITPSNINDVEITLNHQNLQYLCLACHNTKHFGKDVEVIREGLAFDTDGNIIENMV